MAIECELDETIIEHQGKDVTGLILVCGECDHCVSRPGYDTSENRRLILEHLENTCPGRAGYRHVIADMIEQ